MKALFGNAPGHVNAEVLSSYLDNQVSPVEHSRIDAHLRTCPACRAELASLRQTVALLQALPRVPVPRAFTLSEAQVGVPRRTGGWVWGTARALGAVAAVVVVATVAVLMFRQPGQQAATQAPAVARFVVTPTAAPNTAPAAAPVAAPQVPEATAAGAGLTQSQQPSAAAPAAAQMPPTAEQARSQDQLPAAKAAPTEATAPDSQLRSAAGAQPTPSPEVGALALAPQPTEGATAEPGVAAASGPAGTAAPGAPLGLGGGGPMMGAASLAGGTPAPLPPQESPATALSSNTGVAYPDGQSLTVLDAGGTRTLLRAANIGEVSVAPDRSWIAYRVYNETSGELWAVRWNGRDAHKLADESNLPLADGNTGAGHIGEIRWIPGTRMLSLTVTQDNLADPGQLIRPLLVTAGPESSGLKVVAQLGLASSYAFSPGGKWLAVLDRPGSEQPDGKLTLAQGDGSGRRTVMTLGANAGKYVFDSQLVWLPDASALWVALPGAGASYPDHPIFDLYRVPVSGSAVRAGQVTAMEFYWSPDGKSLAYTQSVEGSADARQLVLANANGSNPHVYTLLMSGGFNSWSPDSTHFLYMNGEQFELGSSGARPQPLGNIINPRWAGSGQLLYILNQPSFWGLVSYTVADGKAVTVAQIPQGIPVDVVGR